MSGIKTHFADLIFGRPCCSATNAPVTHDETLVTCKTCQRILARCAASMAQRNAERTHAHG